MKFNIKRTPKGSFLSYILIFLSGYFCYKVFSSDKLDNLLTNGSTVVSLVVSFFAYMIANRTYESIDSVNNITQMEGNVLENESYVTPMTLLLRDYKAKDSKDLGIAVFNRLESMFSKKAKTATDFSRNLQYFIDIIILFPYLFDSSNPISTHHKNRMNKILKLIDKEKDELMAISNGNLILINETVKLINCITDYQKFTNSEQKDSMTLLEVRGSMLKNSVTQTVYYDYLGLFFNTKAMGVLRKKLGFTQDEDHLSISGLKKINNTIHILKEDDTDYELFTLYLREAKKAFKQALEYGKNDMMWEGFIKYNEARSTYFLQLVDTSYEGTDWEEIMNEAVVARNRLNILIEDILKKDTEHTYLQETFIYEGYWAGLVRMNMLIANNRNIPDAFSRPKYFSPQYEGILNDPLIKKPYEGGFDRVKTFQDNIKAYLETLNRNA